MRHFARPRVVISRCIEFDHVRWNAQIIRSDFVRDLLPHVEHIKVCPEVEIGLGVPRDPLRIVKTGEGLRLIQPSTGLDVTERMLEFTDTFLDSLGEVDGFILKSRSPTSALRGAKIYPAPKDAASIGRGPGFFGGAVKERFPHLALEEEGRLNNTRIREHFLRKLFTMASFRELKASDDINDLIRFQTENKLLLKSYSSKEQRMLGKIVANKERKNFQALIEDYSRHLYKAFDRAPRCTSYINVLMSALGYFKGKLSKDERAFFLDSVKRYREGRVPLIALVDVVRSWIVRFQEEYLMKQTFFEPYPEELLDVDSIVEACGDRDYWKEM